MTFVNYSHKTFYNIGWVLIIITKYVNTKPNLLEHLLHYKGKFFVYGKKKERGSAPVAQW